MRIGLIGARGQLGTDLRSVLVGDVVPLDHDQLEITDREQVQRVLAETRPEVVINTAAYNLVDRAEDEPQSAYSSNALGPRNLALECQALGIPLCQVSTDYVFGADATRSTPFSESIPPGPVSAYGVSKLAGEYFVQAHCSQHYVVRTCGLYGIAGSRGKGNFVETMLRLGKQRSELSVVDDQLCTPTSTLDLAKAIAGLIQTGKFGLYHATNGGQMTWCEFARQIFQLAGLNVTVNPITTATFGAKAQRPQFSVLDCAKLENALGWKLPDWKTALAEYLKSREV